MLAAAFPRPPFKTADQIRRALRCPRLPRAIPFALIRRPERYLEKPVGYEALGDLVAGLHRDRRGRGIELQDAALQLEGETKARAGVSVWTLSETGDRHDYLGWCWLDGGGRDVLTAAIRAAQPRADASA